MQQKLNDAKVREFHTGERKIAFEESVFLAVEITAEKEADA